MHRIWSIYLSFHVLFYRPNIDVLTFARTECDPIYAGFRYADMGSNYLMLYCNIKNLQQINKVFSLITPLLYYCWMTDFLSFSSLQPHRVFTVEQAMSGGGDTTAQCCTYEIVQGKVWSSLLLYSWGFEKILLLFY